MASLPEKWLASRGSNQFIKRGNISGCDLQGADFRDIRLEMVDASGADLRASSWQNFRGLDCNFTGANFLGADLSGARFMDCLLSEANLSGCLMEEVMLGMCMLNVSDLRGAVLNRADLGGSSFEAARFTDAELVAVNAKRAIFRDADLRNADLRRGNFELASFAGAKLEGVQWEGANLEGAAFDPGTGRRILESALVDSPSYALSSFIAYECTEGARIWHVIMRRDSGEAILRVDELNLSEGRLAVVFERLDPQLKLLPACALISFALLRDFLADKYDHSASRVTFQESKSHAAFVLPG